MGIHKFGTPTGLSCGHCISKWEKLCQPSKHAWPSSEALWSRPLMVIMASKHAWPNSEALWSRPLMVIMASSSWHNQALNFSESGFKFFRIRLDCIYAGSNFLHLIWFRPFKKGPDYIVQNRQNPIWMAWSGFGQMHVVWKQVSVQESLGLVLAECYRPSTSFPLSDSAAFFHRRCGS